MNSMVNLHFQPFFLMTLEGEAPSKAGGSRQNTGSGPTPSDSGDDKARKMMGKKRRIHMGFINSIRPYGSSRTFSGSVWGMIWGAKYLLR